MKDSNKESKLLQLYLINYFPKGERNLRMVKENLEEDVTGGRFKFIATRWTVRAKYFKRIFENYAALQETWKECLQKIGCCQTQMKTLNYSIFFGILLGK